VTVLDAYAVVAYLRGEPAAERVRPLLEDAGGALTAVGLTEVLDHLVRLARADEDDAALDLGQLRLLDPIPIDAAIGAAAGLLRARRYHRTRCAVSMADCIAAETARATGRALATADPHLLDVCHTEGIASAPLPASDGATWTPPTNR
jgi:predicted nucleic acid-binding protein